MDAHRLVKECIKGRPEAQRQLYDEFSELMLAVCYRYTKSLMDAEDVMQEAFIKVFKNIHQFKFEGELGGWIRRIMVNTAINYLKQNRHYQSDLSFFDNSMHPVSDDNPDVNILARDLADIIRQLPTGYQTIFNLYAVEGFTHVEIAKIMGINEGTSRSQYARARGLLITWLEKQSMEQKTNTYVRP
ncbi:MAG: sigma-70 family RNA polymerase sigma factor [Chitinophagaceae bacterium]|nr:sigma-70 family RNA polymerase sigma factor [Chitinophagaceae bacterium]